MIRFSCPNCSKKLAVDDSKAGAVGVCPACRNKLKIPAPAVPATAPQAADTPASTKPAASPQDPATHQVGDGSDIPLGNASDLPYTFKEDSKAPGPEETGKRKRRRGKGKDSAGGIDYDLLGIRTKSVKEKKDPEPELFPGVSYFKALLSMGIFGWAVCLLYIFMIGGAYVVLTGLLLGLGLADAGFTWFLFLVMKRGNAGSQKPLIIGVVGIVMLISLFLLGHLTGAIAQG
jgi:hypothetical protein